VSGTVKDMTLKLRAEPQAPSVARRVLGRLPGLDAAMLETARLLISELVTNSYRHGKLERDDDIELTISSQPDRLHVEVLDYGAGFDQDDVSSNDPNRSSGENGWGLRIVQQLSDRWGVEDNGRTLVWFDLMKSA